MDALHDLCRMGLRLEVGLQPEKSGLSFWASAWILGFLCLLSAAVWPQAWAQVAMVEPGDSIPRGGWWSEHASLRARERLAFALREIQTESWARERAAFLANLADREPVLKGLVPEEELAFEFAPPPPGPDLAQRVVQWMVGRRLPTEFEVRSMEEVIRTGSSPYIDMRLDGVTMAVGIPVSSQMSLRGGVLADFVMTAPLFSSEGILRGDLYRYFSNMGYSLGFDFSTGAGDVLFGRVIVRGANVSLPGQPTTSECEPLFLGVMVGTQFDRNWAPVRTSASR
jgi:hypothetical protein